MMDLSKVDNLLFLASFAAQLILLFVLLKRRLYREFPIFTTYVVLVMLSDPILILWLHLLNIPSAQMQSDPIYFRAFMAFKVPEYILGFSVLVEIARDVLQPHKRKLPSGSLAIFAGLLVLGGIITYVLAAHSGSGSILTSTGGTYVTVTLINAALRIVCFVVIAVFAQMLGIGWRNHVVQLATGLAFYGAVDLIVRLAHARLSAGGSLSVYYSQYRLLDQLRVIGYLSTLTFWCWSFARKEAPRKEFSPQMERFLVSIAGVAKRDRSQFGR